ncbi:MAG: proline iminopeptidase-family hydrolase [Crocinitomix sp.]|nr:proline iminopeptidase-family hydrolase [Crocinitomix sp.]
MRLLLSFISLFLVLGVNQITYAQTNPVLEDGEGYLAVNGGKLWYRIIGEGDETPLLMMHGGPGGTSRSFYLFEKLTKDRPIILFDQLGTGRSGHHEDTSLLKVNEFVEQVADLTKHLNLNSVYLYGHSWGTALALEYFSAYSKGVEGIIFNSPYFSTAIWEADADTLITFLPLAAQKAIAEGEASGDFSAKSYQQANSVYLSNYGSRGKRHSSDLDTAKAPGNYFIYNYMWGPTEFTATGTLKNYDIIDKLKKVTVPTLFITGEYDEARPATVRSFEKIVPGSSTVILKRAGHATMHDNLCQNRKAIRKFLKSLEN